MNLGQRLGELQLAAGLYGPAEGPPSTLRSPINPEAEQALHSARGEGVTMIIRRVLPTEERCALTVGVISQRSGGAITPSQVAMNVVHMKDVRRLGEPGSYRYYRVFS